VLGLPCGGVPVGELERRETAYRRDQFPLNLRGQTVILVDDGLATGSTMQAAVTGVRRLQAARVVVAAPVGAPEARRSFSAVADEVICARQLARFNAAGQWHPSFPPTTDAEVDELLARAWQALAAMHA
jgi:putative phosphoribosyl transferase